MTQIAEGMKVKVARVPKGHPCALYAAAELGKTLKVVGPMHDCGQCEGRSTGIGWFTETPSGGDAYCLPEECLSIIEDNAHPGLEKGCTVAGTMTEYALWADEMRDEEGKVVQKAELLLPASAGDPLPRFEGTLTLVQVREKLLMDEKSRELIASHHGPENVSVTLRPFS